MQIDIDFEVFKALTAQRESEGDSFNEVIRRLLGLPASNLQVGPTTEPDGKTGESRGLMGGGQGVWYSNVFFADGTEFRATYKGKRHFARIEEGIWTDERGIKRKSPSDAASAISKTNVNGSRFWFVKQPFDGEWVRMDSLRP